MAENIVLKTYKGGRVTPQDDAIIRDAALSTGIFKGCEVSYARGNILHINQGFGMIKGRFFEVYDSEIAVELAKGTKVYDGRLYVHLDLANTDDPIKLLTVTGETLPVLEEDDDLNYNDSMYDLELAVFQVSSSSLSNLSQTFEEIKGSGTGGGGKELIERKKEYFVGDVGKAVSSPGWATFVCIKAGFTGEAEPVEYASVTKKGDRVTDGDAVFEARDCFGELTSLDTDVTAMKEIMDDPGVVRVKSMTTDQYKALSEYSDTTLYLCHEEDNPNLVTAIYMGENHVYSQGTTVTYHFDTGLVADQFVSFKDDAILRAPKAEKAGYTFVGWKTSDEAGSDVLTEYLVTSEEPFALYAVFKKEITLTYYPNGGTGEMDADVALAYYNNGNGVCEDLKVKSCEYTREGQVFCGWSTDSVSDPTLFPGNDMAVGVDSGLYAMWAKYEEDFPYTGSYRVFPVPADGLYLLEVWGAQGGSVKKDGVQVGVGGKGGYARGYKEFKKGDKIYVYPGGQGDGVNGGGAGVSISSYNVYGGIGGGLTHMAAISQELSYFVSDKTDKKDQVYLVAGGGGGAVSSETAPKNGGDGGGEMGGDGSGGAFGGRMIPIGFATPFGRGQDAVKSGNTPASAGGGGGGGFYGGGCGTNSNSGAGGCGYIGGVPSFTKNGIYYGAEMETGVNEGNGKAKITYLGVI